MSEIRLHALLIPNRDWPTLVERVRYLDGLGAHTVWIDDHFAHPADPSMPWLDAWSALAAWAASTERIALGTLVSSAVLRSPAMLARQALSVEHISAGRLELGLGSGYSPGDHAAVGTPMWSPIERADRFADCVRIVDAVLRGEPVGDIPVLAPRPQRTPRPPLTVAAHGPRALAVAAQYADRWVSYGGFGLSAAEHLAITRARVRGFERACAAIGRDARTVRRALLLGSAATTADPIWRDVDAAQEWIERYVAIGIDDFVLYYPPAEVWPAGRTRDGVFEQLFSRYG